MLESLGYLVKIKGSPIVDDQGELITMDAIVAANVDNDAGSRDLIALYATAIEDQDAVGTFVLDNICYFFVPSLVLTPLIGSQC